jgi:hypothetical protein
MNRWLQGVIAAVLVGVVAGLTYMIPNTNPTLVGQWRILCGSPIQ